MTPAALGSLSFSSSTPLLLATLVVAAGALWLGLTHWRRNRHRPVFVALEGLRLALIVLIVITLFQPELVHHVESAQRDTVVVLHDRSGSMLTQDVRSEGGGTVTRDRWAETVLSNANWSALLDAGDVLHIDFPASNRSDRADGTDLHRALAETLRGQPALRAVILLSDGDWTAGEPPSSAAETSRIREVPIFALSIGSDTYLPDLALSGVRTPSYGLLDENLVIPFHLQNRMDREIRTAVELTGTDGTRVSKKVQIGPRGDLRDTIVLPPTREGTFDYRLSVPELPEESIVSNNTTTFQLAFRRETLRALLIESRPRWEYRFLRNALTRDPGVEVDCLLLHPDMPAASGPGYLDRFPDDREELGAYDVIFLGDVGIGPDELADQDAEQLAGTVKQMGSGIVFIPGIRGRQQTLRGSALEPLIPVQFADDAQKGLPLAHPAHLRLTRLGRDHLLTSLAGTPAENERLWKTLPGFHWSADVLKSQPGTETLAVHQARRNEWGRIPLLVVGDYGTGKTLFLGTDGAWRWRRGVEDVYHYRFWAQVVRWMAHRRHMASNRNLMLFSDPETPYAGDTIRLHLTATSASGQPVSDARIPILIRDPSGATIRIGLDNIDPAWGAYAGAFTPTVAGDHHFTIEVEGLPPLNRIQHVRSPTLEKVGRPAQAEVLRELADISGGDFRANDGLQDLIDQVALVPRSRIEERRVRLWSNPLWGGIIIVLLSAYWIGRKLAGVI